MTDTDGGTYSEKIKRARDYLKPLLRLKSNTWADIVTALSVRSGREMKTMKQIGGEQS